MGRHISHPIGSTLKMRLLDRLLSNASETDAELTLWVRGRKEPIVKTFKDDASLDRVYQLIGRRVLE